jgi:DNA-binding NtrC family response regulator
MEAELFGARRGAYTGSDRDRPGLFRVAHGGTLFLDEVGDMPPALQGKLLRVLQERRFRPLGSVEEVEADVRIVAASHRDLTAAALRGGFRSDLYYRLAVLHVRVPPLRERLDDLPLLIGSLEARLVRETGRGPLRLAPSALDRLLAHDWPGNVRELHAALARALVRSGGAEITADHLEPLGAAAAVATPTASGLDLERRMIVAALSGSAGNLAQAARRIGWTRQKLYRRLRALGIRRSVRAGAQPPSAEVGGSTSSDSSTFQ